MSNNRKVFGAVLGVLMGTCVSAALAQNAPVAAGLSGKTDAILFKIHEIQPLKNAEGMVIACNFNATFYNRSPKDISNASLRLSWRDEAISSVISDEKKERAAQEPGRIVGNQTSYTERVTPAEISATIDLPALKAYKQITLHSKIQADRCFLLLNDATFTVNSCQASETTGIRGASASNCGGLFNFVSAKNPEYYREFKKISYNDEKVIKQSEKEKDQKELNKAYNDAVDSLTSISNTLARIK